MSRGTEFTEDKYAYPPTRKISISKQDDIITVLKAQTAEDNAEWVVQLQDSRAELLAVCEAVLDWAKTPGNHGGNPYCKDFVRLAEEAVRKNKAGQHDGQT